MNTTVNVNLAGQHFYFDQAAKVKFEVYFENQIYFTDESFLQELMTDVEARIAELLNDIIVDTQCCHHTSHRKSDESGRSQQL